MSNEQQTQDADVTTAAMQPVKSATLPQVGDVVILRGKIIAVGDGVVMFQTDPVDLPGSPGYTQQIALYGAQTVKV